MNRLAETSVSAAVAVIFDMDGVLLDSEPLHLHAMNEVLRLRGAFWPESENSKLLGLTLPETWDLVRIRLELPGDIDSLIGEYDRAVLQILRGALEPALGARHLLESLRSHEIPLGLASSSRRTWIDATLESLGFARMFDVIVSGDDVSRGNPDPEIYLRAAQEIGMKVHRCAAIEDAPHGITSAVRAGMPVVAVRTPSTTGSDLSQASLIVSSLEELTVSTLLALTQ